MDGRECTSCKTWKSRADFYVDNRAKDGMGARCKPCQKAATRASYAKHREKMLARQSDYYKRYPERRKAALDKWVKKNPEIRAEIKKRYREKHPDKIKADNLAYYEANRARLLERAAAWREANPNRKRNPEQGRKDRERRRARLLDAYVEDVSLDQLILEERGLCGICREPITGTLEVDHIIPLSKGGTHERANVQLAHLACNRKKAARVETRAA